MAMSDRMLGTVKWFDNAKGYGFIYSEDIAEEEKDIFVHFRAIRGDGYRSLIEGQQVEYVPVRTQKGFQASDVIILTENEMATEAAETEVEAAEVEEA